MVFDANLVLHDGTEITADITPTSTTRASGSAVIDLKKTPATGLYAVMIVGADLAEASDTLAVSIQHSASEATGYETVASFPTLTQGSNMPGTWVLRFSANRMLDGSVSRYVRALIDVTDNDAGGDFSATSVEIMITPHAEVIGW